MYITKFLSEIKKTPLIKKLNFYIQNEFKFNQEEYRNHYEIFDIDLKKFNLNYP